MTDSPEFVSLAIKACRSVVRQLRNLPRFKFGYIASLKERFPGIYMVYTKSGELFYVGKAKNIPARLRIHLKDEHGPIVRRLPDNKPIEKIKEDIRKNFSVSTVLVNEKMYRDHAYKTELFVQLILMPKYGMNGIYSCDLSI